MGQRGRWFLPHGQIAEVQLECRKDQTEQAAASVADQWSDSANTNTVFLSLVRFSFRSRNKQVVCHILLWEMSGTQPLKLRDGLSGH